MHSNLKRRPINRIISGVITTHDSLTAIAAAVTALAIILFGIAVQKARHARQAAYYVTRRQAQDTANRQLIWAMLLLVIAAGAFIASWIIPQEARPDQAAAREGPPTINPTVVILTTMLQTPDLARSTEQQPSTQLSATDASPMPSTPTDAAPSDTATRAPTFTAEPSSLSPQATAVNTAQAPTDVPALTEIETATPAPALGDKHFTLRAIASGIDASGLPINPSLQFDTGVPSIYIFFDFQNVPEGRRLRHNWFRDGGSVYFESLPWERTGSGNAAINWSPPNGFDRGIYEVRVFLDDQLQFIANFEVK